MNLKRLEQEIAKLEVARGTNRLCAECNGAVLSHGVSYINGPGQDREPQTCGRCGRSGVLIRVEYEGEAVSSWEVSSAGVGNPEWPTQGAKAELISRINKQVERQK